MTRGHIAHPGDARWETRLLAVIVATLTVFGIVSLYGAASFQQDAMGFAIRQTIGAVLGGVLLLLSLGVDYHRWRAFAWPMLLATIAALLIPLLPVTQHWAPEANGARRWVRFGSLSFQPAEVAKFAIVVWSAMLATKKGERVRGFKRGVAPFLVGIGLVTLLILLEPDLSMAALVGLLGGLVLFTAGAKIGHFLLLGMGVLLLGFQQIKDAHFRAVRFLDWLNLSTATNDPDSQIIQSLIGMGSGGFFGVGFGQGQLKLGHLQYAYSDFLFSTIGEEWGLLGVIVIAGCYALFCWVGFRIAKTAADPFGRYLATGITAAIGITAVLHMAVTLGLIPTTGLTLPFMSYGRSSLMMSLLMAGVLMNIGRYRGRRATA